MDFLTLLSYWHFTLNQRVFRPLLVVVFSVSFPLMAASQKRFSEVLKNPVSQYKSFLPMQEIPKKEPPELKLHEEQNSRVSELCPSLEDSFLHALLVSEQGRLNILFGCASEEEFFQQLKRIPPTSVCWRILPFQSPTNSTLSLRTSSPFGYRRHPLTKRWTLHKGIDIAAPAGTSVYAAGAGLVANAGYDPLLGNFVRINHGFGWSSVYGHLSTICVQSGTRILSTQLIGRTGNTGRSTGPHLHFGVYYNQRPVDGFRFLNLLRRMH